MLTNHHIVNVKTLQIFFSINEFCEDVYAYIRIILLVQYLLRLNYPRLLSGGSTSGLTCDALMKHNAEIEGKLMDLSNDDDDAFSVGRSIATSRASSCTNATFKRVIHNFSVSNVAAHKEVGIVFILRFIVEDGIIICNNVEWNVCNFRVTFAVIKFKCFILTFI